jgi:hypothetical protein
LERKSHAKYSNAADPRAENPTPGQNGKWKSWVYSTKRALVGMTFLGYIALPKEIARKIFVAGASDTLKHTARDVATGANMPTS